MGYYNRSDDATINRVVPEESFIGSVDSYYFIKVKCSNCGYEGKVYVQKKTHLFFANCPDCECQRCLSFIEKCKVKKSDNGFIKI